MTSILQVLTLKTTKGSLTTRKKLSLGVKNTLRNSYANLGDGKYIDFIATVYREIFFAFGFHFQSFAYALRRAIFSSRT